MTEWQDRYFNYNLMKIVTIFLKRILKTQV